MHFYFKQKKNTSIGKKATDLFSNLFMSTWLYQLPLPSPISLLKDKLGKD